MRVLLTRPQAASGETTKRLRELGHQPILLPLMQAEHYLGPTLEGLQKSHAAIALTSAEAVRVLQALGPQLVAYLETPVFAVGDATASAARAAGFEKVEAAGGTAASMIALFGHRFRSITSQQPLLYIAGNPRTATFEAGLAELEIPFFTVEGYAMKPLHVDEPALSAALENPPVDVVLLYSPATAKCFFSLPFTARGWNVLRRSRILCLSHNVARAVPASLQTMVAVSERPDEDSLLALL